ncbi:MAG: autorepressor SdpR family transcription factor [Candidatus Faecivivens sp.]|nr:autorepressor SdpR family transcription factor [Candidatus Faecivivens sp.]
MNDAFKALSDPTRRKILQLLSKGDMTAGEIADCFEMTKPSVSHHLSMLKGAGLIDDERRGQNIIYSLNMTVFQQVLQWFFEISGTGVQQAEGEDEDGHEAS